MCIHYTLHVVLFKKKKLNYGEYDIILWRIIMWYSNNYWNLGFIKRTSNNVIQYFSVRYIRDANKAGLKFQHSSLNGPFLTFKLEPNSSLLKNNFNYGFFTVFSLVVYRSKIK